MRFSICCFVTMLAVSPLPTLAQSAGAVDALQMPAWVERGGEKHALRADAQLQSGDVVSTGGGSRVLMKLEEGSVMKLGENARLSLDILSAPRQQDGVFEALMRVTRGAYRFTTSAIGKLRKRKVDVHIGAVTIGLRGTDFWGKSNDDSDVLVLLEGKVSTQREGEAPILMNEPNSLFVAPAHQASLPLQTIDQAKLAVWAAETELQSQTGVVRADGTWALNLMSVQSDAAAQTLQAQLDTAGYATDVEAVVINAQTWYRVRIKGFVSRDDASALAAQINGQYGIQQPWLVRF